jgi:hypothetical protein
MIRASMLADTIAARLDNDQDPYREFRYYEKGAGRRARKRLFKRVRRLFGPGKWTRLENGIEGALKMVYQVQRTVDSLGTIGIIPMVGKAARGVALVMSLMLRIAILTTIFAMYYAFVVNFGKIVSLKEILIEIFSGDHNFHTIVAINILITGRELISRLRDRDY